MKKALSITLCLIICLSTILLASCKKTITTEDETHEKFMAFRMFEKFMNSIIDNQDANVIVKNTNNKIKETDYIVGNTVYLTTDIGDKIYLIKDKNEYSVLVGSHDYNYYVTGKQNYNTNYSQTLLGDILNLKEVYDEPEVRFSCKTKTIEVRQNNKSDVTIEIELRLECDGDSIVITGKSVNFKVEFLKIIDPVGDSEILTFEYGNAEINIPDYSNWRKLV